MESTAPQTAATAGLPSLYEQKVLVDLVLQVGQSTYPVHKIIMAAVSGYFKASITGAPNMAAEGGNPTMVIDGVTSYVMEILLEFIYKKRLNLTKRNVQEVLAGAIRLQMEATIKACTEFMVRDIDEDNWFGLLTLFKKYKLQAAADTVKAFVRSNIWHIAKTFNSRVLDHNDMQFFTDNWLRSETDLFKFIMTWLNAEFEARKGHIDDLMSRVRFGLMSPEELKAMKDLKIFSNLPNTWSHLVHQAYEYHKLRIRDRVMNQSEQTKIRSPPTVVRFLWPMKMESEGSFYELHERGRFMEHKALTCPDTSGGKFLGEIVVNNFLIVHRNVNGNEQWHIFDPRSMKWARMGNAPRKLPNAVLVHADKFLYAIGGVKPAGRSPIEESIERFDFTTNNWDTFATLPRKIKDFGACCIGKFLYISGGQKHSNNKDLPVGTIWRPANSDEEEYNERLFDKPLNKLDCLDLSSGTWTTKPPMLEPRCKHAMQTMRILDEEVCCIFDKDFDLEYYSPSKNQWSCISFTFTGRAPVKVIKSHLCYYRGNSCIIVDAHVRSVHSEEYNTCAVVRFPESGTEATVEYMKEYVGRRTWCMMGGHTALAINPASYQDQLKKPLPTKEPTRRFITNKRTGQMLDLMNLPPGFINLL